MMRSASHTYPDQHSDPGRKEHMVAWDRVTRTNVLRAIQEYERHGPEGFSLRMAPTVSLQRDCLGPGNKGHTWCCSTVVSRSCELEDLEGSVHDAAGLATGFGDVTSAGEMVGADCEVAQAGHDAGS